MKTFYTKIDLSQHKNAESFNYYVKQMMDIYDIMNNNKNDRRDLQLVFISCSVTDVWEILYPYAPKLNFGEETYIKFQQENDRYINLYIHDVTEISNKILSKDNLDKI